MAEDERLRKCVAAAWDFRATQIKNGVPPVDVMIGLLTVALSTSKSLGESPARFMQIALQVVRKLEGDHAAQVLQLRQPIARRRR